MGGSIPVAYGDFYDYPRMVEFFFDGDWYFLRSYSEEEPDEYFPYCDVYGLPFRSGEELKQNRDYWDEMKGADHLGRILIEEIGWDPTQRKSIDESTFAQWLETIRE